MTAADDDVLGLVLEATTADYTGMWWVVGLTRDLLPHLSDGEVRTVAMAVVTYLLANGLVAAGPVDVPIAEWKEPWRGSLTEILGRIEARWDEVGEPKMWDVCWMVATRKGRRTWARISGTPPDVDHLDVG